jgi:hypothetical protein
MASVGMKVGKKQSPVSEFDRQFEQSLLSLENVCLNVMDSRFVHDRQDMEGLYWQRRFKNIVTPISLALAEYRGPRRFHYHYRHRKDDESVLHPVMEDPIDTLAQVCKSTLAQCQTDLVGIADGAINKKGRMLEQALRNFLHRYDEHKEKIGD